MVACSGLRRLQLLIQLFNQSNSAIIFTFKNVCISISIVGGFFSIRYGTLHPVTGIVCALTTLDALVFYSFIYEKAFLIPNRMEEVKSQVRVLAQKVQGGTKVKGFLLKVIRSVPPVAVKVGRFHTMERISTLTFLNFVFCQIVGLLLAFK